MRSLLRLLATVGLFALGSLPTAAQSELWDRAVALYAGGEGFVPGKMVTVMEELNTDGSRKSLSKTDMTLLYGADGKSRGAEIVSAWRDGKDVTDEARRNMSGRAAKGGDSGSFGFDGMLFDRTSQTRIQLLPEASWSTREGRRVGEVPFTMNLDGNLGTLRGSAEIDAETGIPIEVRTASKGFPFVKDLTFNLFYSPLPSGGFALTEMDFDGIVSFLLVTKPFRGSIAFSDYRRVASPEARAGSGS